MERNELQSLQELKEEENKNFRSCKQWYIRKRKCRFSNKTYR